METLMAWRNIWRNPRRTILTILAIAFACLLLIFMLSLQLGTYEVMIDASVKAQTGHIQVLQEGYNEDFKIRKIIKNPKELVENINKIPHVTALTTRANAFALLSSDKRSCAGMIRGIVPEKEALVSNTANTIKKGRFLKPSDNNAAIIGDLLAKNLKINIGDEIVVLGSGKDGSVAATVLKVVGIFSLGMDDYDRSFIQIPMHHFQETFVMGHAVHEIVLTCDSLKNVKPVQTAIKEILANQNREKNITSLTWEELSPGLLQSIQMDIGGGLIFYAILLVMVAFSIMNTFVMSVFERTREFGTLIAIGARPGRLSKMLLLESGFLTLCGISLGILSGCALTFWLQHTGIPMGSAEGMLKQYGIPGEIKPQLTLLTASIGPMVVSFITLLTALFPAFKVHRIIPVEAMRAA